MRKFFLISVHVTAGSLAWDFYRLNEKNELALSRKNRLCSIRNNSAAQFETKEHAKQWLDSVKQKPEYSYSILECRSLG